MIGALIFPHQIFEQHPALPHVDEVFFIEEFLLFSYQSFHKQRLILLKTAQQEFVNLLKEKGLSVHVIGISQCKERGSWASALPKSIEALHVADPVDEWLLRDLCEQSKKNKWELIVHDTPQFLLSQKEVDSYFSGKKRLLMADYYKKVRLDRQILVDQGKPKGGKWSFDELNRKPLPKGHKPPSLWIPNGSESVEKSKKWVAKHCPNSLGEDQTFFYPTTHKEAKKWLKVFLKDRLSLFGPYEDALCEQAPFLYHSLLSPLLNCGLLTPHEVLEGALLEKNVPIQSLEGFVRQILGWREFMRGTYEIYGPQMRRTNFFKHKKKIPKALWDGTTGIVPVDHVIQKVLKNAYAHHIERLMVIGNFMLLCEIDPEEIYRWFMALFIDAYDWVMVPNVYAMSQFADGGLIVTKPYVSSSSYICKMSNYEKGSWCEIWDGLFWRFLKKHKALFGKNPRTRALLSNFERNPQTIEKKIRAAELFLKLLFK